MLHRLDLQVQQARIIRLEALSIESLEDSCCNQCDNPLAVGRQFMEPPIPVLHFECIHPLGTMGSQVGSIKQSVHPA